MGIFGNFLGRVSGKALPENSFTELRIKGFHTHLNLQANIFLGNYYYLQAERKKKTLEDNYKKIVSPTRMQYASYRNGLSDVFANGYDKAKNYLQKVLQLFPSTEAGKTLERIKILEKEMNK